MVVPEVSDLVVVVAAVAAVDPTTVESELVDPLALAEFLPMQEVSAVGL